MKKNATLTVFLIMICLIGLSKCNAQEQFVTMFYADAASYGRTLPVKKVTIEVKDLPNANGRIDRMPDGSLRIVIEKVFFEYYQLAPQTQRLIYYLLAHELLGMNPGNGVMDADKVYVPMKRKDLDRLFRTT